MNDETVDGDVRWADLSEWLRDRALVLRLVLFRGIFLAELTPEDDARMWASSGTMPSEAISRARLQVQQTAGEFSLPMWQRRALCGRAGQQADIVYVLEWRHDRRGGEADASDWSEHSRHVSAAVAFDQLDVMDPVRAALQWQVRAVRAAPDQEIGA